jgi:hypothetical protein
MSDIEGKVTRVGATKRGQRRSFKSETDPTSSPPNLSRKFPFAHPLTEPTYPVRAVAVRRGG